MDLNERMFLKPWRDCSVGMDKISGTSLSRVKSGRQWPHANPLGLVTLIRMTSTKW